MNGKPLTARSCRVSVGHAEPTVHAGAVEDRDLFLLKRVVASRLSGLKTEWLVPNKGWSGHVRISGASGFVGYLLTSPEWQEARFEEPHLAMFLLTTADEDDVIEALTRLAKIVASYVNGGAHLESRQRRFGRSEQILVVPTDEGDWRIGKRTTWHPIA